MNRGLALVCLAWLGGCADPVGRSGASSEDDFVGANLGLQLKSEGPPKAEAAAGAHLTYFGGPVISSVAVHAVFWGSGVNFQTELNHFYAAVANSSYLDWLSEYNTPTQTIGRGKLASSLVDSSPPSGSSISDAQIQGELGRLMDSGQLPPPSANNLYMVHFPPGITITQVDGSASCQVFCAYHGTFVKNGVDVYYGVMPDLGGACATGCGTGSQLANTTSATSHEMTEAITDSAVGLATSVAAPLAWYDQANGEIGDICNQQTGTVAGFTVQLEWSNKQNACVASSGTSCTPSCGGKSCGDDGCGGSCGTCPSGQTCSATGQCVASCTPSCGGKSCGSDGCGGSCGTCPAGDTCTPSGQCQPPMTSCSEIEPNDIPAQANSLCSDGTISGTINPTGDVDWYHFNVNKKQRYTVTLSRLAANFNMTLFKQSTTGKLTLVETAADMGDLSNQTISHRATSGGTYLLKVFGVQGATSTQPYLVSVVLN